MSCLLAAALLRLQRVERKEAAGKTPLHAQKSGDAKTRHASERVGPGVVGRTMPSGNEDWSQSIPCNKEEEQEKIRTLKNAGCGTRISLRYFRSAPPSLRILIDPAG